MKVGDYVRTPQGIITKIVNIQEDTEQYFLNGNAVSLESKNYIADKNITIGENFKNSPNIIDLIEVGDYVNGSYVEGFIEKNKFQNKLIITEARMIDNNDIKSIVTKEQFSCMEYKIGE